MTPIAFVTGASRGIGRAAALALARAGYDVVITARTIREGDGRAVSAASATAGEAIVVPGSLETTASAIEALGRRALPIRMDLLDRASVAGAADEAMATWGRVDVLVNNAIYQGPGALDPILEIDLDVADTMMRADYLHQLLLVQRLVPAMIERGSGTVISLISPAGYTEPVKKGFFGISYAAAKSAMGRITPILQIEHADDGIRAFSIDPGFVLNERMIALGSGARYAKALQVGTPEVIGAVIAWLVTAPEAVAHVGKTVLAQPLCTELGLVVGWPPPRAAN